VLLTLALVASAQSGVGCGAAAEDRDHRDREATVFREERVAPRIIDLNVRSPALGTTAMVRLLTPEGWATGRSSRRWPVLYLLHGCCDSYESWTRSTDIERWPKLRNVLVVMPEGGAVGFYTNWRGSEREPGPAWETFHLTELRQLLERHYGAGPDRAIAGLSMGGHGAMVYAARSPRLFRAAASFSGVLHPLQDADFILGLFSAFTPNPRAIWGDPARDRSIWARHDPTELADRLRGVPLFVSAGNGRPGPLAASEDPNDAIEPRVLRESRAFVARLQSLDIPVRADFYGNGTHAWPYFERELERALPTLLGALSASSAEPAAFHQRRRSSGAPTREASPFISFARSWRLPV
jgi:diacylglycerol O-acyltransferase / trehalose O-mycolyltransferase